MTEGPQMDLPIDKGWAWVVLIACTAITTLQAGTLRSFGLFFIEFLTEFRAEVSQTAVINSVQTAVYAITCIPVLMFGLKRFSERQLALIGFVLGTMGYALSCLATSLNFLIFSLSILVGTGSAVGFCPVFIVLGRYFNKRRGLANGLMVSGSCIGSLSLPPLIRYFLDEYGLRGALLLTAGVYSHVIIFTALLRPLSFYSDNKKKDKIDNEVNKPLLDRNSHVKEGKEAHIFSLDGHKCEKSNGKVPQEPLASSEPNLWTKEACVNRRRTKTISEGDHKQYPRLKGRDNAFLINRSLILSTSITDVAWEVFDDKAINKDTTGGKTRQKMFDLSVLKRMEFLLFLVYYSLACIPGGLGYVFIPVYAKDKQLANHQIVLMLGIMAGADFIGRISCGYLADLPRIRMTYLLMVSQTVIAVTANCARFLDSYWHFYIFVLSYGMFSGMPFSLCTALISRIVGLEQFPTGFALMVLIHQGMLSGSAPILGHLRDATGDFSATFHYFGLSSCAAILFLLLEPLARKFDSKRSQVVKDIEHVIAANNKGDH